MKRRAEILEAQAQERLFAALAMGVPLEVAAALAGLSVRTVYDWLERGEARHPNRRSTRRARAFAKRLREAEAKAIVLSCSVLHQAQRGLRPSRRDPQRMVCGRTDPTALQAAIFFLSRRAPQHFGRQREMRLPDDAPPPPLQINIRVADVPDDTTTTTEADDDHLLR